MAKPREIPAPVFESSSSESSDYSDFESEPAKKAPTRTPAVVLPQKPSAKAPPKDSSSDESSDSEPEPQPAKKAPRIHTPVAALHQKPLAKASAQAADSTSDESSDSDSDSDSDPALLSDDSSSSDSELVTHVKKPSSSAFARSAATPVEEWIFGEGMELLDDEVRSELENEWKELRKEKLRLSMKRKRFELSRRHVD